MATKRLSITTAVLIFAAVLCACVGRQSRSPADTLAARTYNSGFADAHDTYNGISVATNGKVYYVLSSERFDVAAQMFSFDPETEKIEHLGDLTEACGEKGQKVIVQGKSHVNFIESGGKLFFASHVGYYTIRDGMETIGDPPPGYGPYPGGHFLAYDIAGRRFEDLAKAPRGEGIISMTMDTKRGRIFGLTWPMGHLLRYDLAGGRLEDLGPVSRQGESGQGAEYRTLCRSLVVDPDSGILYFTNGDGDVQRHIPEKGSIETVEGVDLRKDYFGSYDPASAGHMGYNWRQVFWHAPTRAVYGVHGNSGYLFRFLPDAPGVEVLDRITSLPSKRSGMFDQFSYGYLGFALGPDGRTIHYLTGGPIYEAGRRVEGKKNTAKGESKGRENLHLITWDIPDGRYQDHGPVMLEDGTPASHVNSIAVGKDGSVYALSRVAGDAKARTDLIRVRGPFRSP